MFDLFDRDLLWEDIVNFNHARMPASQLPWHLNRRKYFRHLTESFWQRFDAKYPRGIRIFGFLSHWHGAVTFQVLNNALAWFLRGMPCPIEIVGLITDNALREPELNKVKDRLYAFYEGEELVFLSELVPRLAKLANVPCRQILVDSSEGIEFVKSTEPNVVVSCVNWQWVPREVRELTGERSSRFLGNFGVDSYGKSFGIHPNDAFGDMMGFSRLRGLKPFQTLMRDGDKLARLALHRLVPGHYDHPLAWLVDSDAVQIDQFSELSWNNQFQMIQMMTAELIPGLLRRDLPWLLFPELFLKLEPKLRILTPQTEFLSSRHSLMGIEYPKGNSIVEFHRGNNRYESGFDSSKSGSVLF